MTKQEVNEHIGYFMAKFCSDLGIHVPRGKDVRGNCAGRAYYQRNEVRFNVDMLAEADDIREIESVVGHEIAHIATYKKYHPQRFKPHGWEWKQVMRTLGLKPDRCHNMSVPMAHRPKRYPYKCESCGQVYQFSKVRHNRQLRMPGRYICRCRSELVYVQG